MTKPEEKDSIFLLLWKKVITNCRVFASKLLRIIAESNPFVLLLFIFLLGVFLAGIYLFINFLNNPPEEDNEYLGAVFKGLGVLFLIITLVQVISIKLVDKGRIKVNKENDLGCDYCGNKDALVICPQCDSIMWYKLNWYQGLGAFIAHHRWKVVTAVITLLAVPFIGFVFSDYLGKKEKELIRSQAYENDAREMITALSNVRASVYELEFRLEANKNTNIGIQVEDLINQYVKFSWLAPRVLLFWHKSECGEYDSSKFNICYEGIVKSVKLTRKFDSVCTSLFGVNYPSSIDRRDLFLWELNKTRRDSVLKSIKPGEDNSQKKFACELTYENQLMLRLDRRFAEYICSLLPSKCVPKNDSPTKGSRKECASKFFADSKIVGCVIGELAFSHRTSGTPNAQIYMSCNEEIKFEEDTPFEEKAGVNYNRDMPFPWGNYEKK